MIKYIYAMMGLPYPHTYNVGILCLIIVCKSTERMCLYLLRNIIKHGKKFVVILTAFVLLVSMCCVPYASAATLAEKFGTPSKDNDEIKAETKFKGYLRELAELNPDATDYSGKDIVLTPSEAKVTGMIGNKTKEEISSTAVPLGSAFGKDNIIVWTEDYSSFQWTFTAPVSGFYQIEIDYINTPYNKIPVGDEKVYELAIDATREIEFDGEVPFLECRTLTFKKLWKDEAAPEKNKVGDQIAADLVEISEWQTYQFNDPDGYYEYPIKIYFEAGEHTITLNYSLRDMYLGNITLKAPVSYPSYEEVYASYPTKDLTGTDVYFFQAENFNYVYGENGELLENGYVYTKSSSLLRNMESKDTSTTPFVSGYSCINIVGGESSWYMDRDTITWKFTVPETGLYKISVRVCNNTTIGMPVYRKIMLDGDTPFEELNTYRFKYSYNYYTETLGEKDGDPYYFYLEAGEHILGMQMTMGGLGDIALTFYEMEDALNRISRKINKICGSDPDSNYNYRLEARIPELIPTVTTIIETFKTMIENLKIVCETDSSDLINNISSNVESLEEFVEKPEDIVSNLSTLKDLQTTLGSWISDLESSTLAVDFIEIAEPNGEVSNPKTSFWRVLEDLWKSFIVSFEKDYNSSFTNTGDKTKTSIEVWMSRDREYSDMIVKLMDGYFLGGVDQNGNPIEYYINLRLTPGQIGFGGFNLFLLSYMSGNEPDMLWNVGGGDAVNFAIRGIGYNLKQFDDYDEVVSRFCEASMIPATYQDNTHTRDGVYQIPETGGMNVAFYRTDVFEDMGISVPNTWSEVYDTILPTFYRENYQWVPEGAGVRLMQRNGYPFRCNNLVTGYDTDLYMQCFLEDVDDYQVYGCDLSIMTFQSFRNGTCPYMMGDMGTYTQLMVAAPELLGKWKITLIPGEYDELGVLNRTYGALGGSGFMILDTAEHPEYCWDLIKWWTSTEVQIEFEYMVDAKFGQANRWCSSNMEAYLALPWTTEEREIIKEMYKWYLGCTTVLGSYQQDRYANFANNQVLIQGLNARDSIEQMVQYINPELVRKQLQYDIEPASEEEIAKMEYDISAITLLSNYRAQREAALAKLKEQEEGEAK